MFTVHITPPVKNMLKLRGSRIPVNRISFVAFGNCFRQNRQLVYFADAQVYVDARADQKPEILFGGFTLCNLDVIQII